jgi:cyclophilin family peptidyl-prolyl cis-trans isomerase
VSCSMNSQHLTNEKPQHDEDNNTKNDNCIHRPSNRNKSTSRRQFSEHLIAVSTMAVVVPFTTTPSIAHATRAVGGAEEDCRAAGNCLEKLELDGAVGWSWGAKDRCDATDPLCGSDGRLLDAPPSGDAIPDPLGFTITHIAQITLSIGRNEKGVIRLGLYGNDAPDSVREFLLFMTSNGLKTTSDLVFQNGMGVQSIPVSMTRGGILGQIVPGQRLDFGIPLQSLAYARSKGLPQAGDEFMPQPRPTELKDVPVIRPHDVAGLVSVPGKGIGYGGSGFESDDECYESAFQITAAPQPSMDKKENRRVIGQVMDAPSMTTLARLASLPTKKGFRGVIPGQNSGPPLLKVVLTDVEVQSKADSVAASL